MPTNQKQLKVKHKLDFIKIKGLCAENYTIKKVKRQPMERRKLVNHISGKDLYAQYIMNSYNSIIKR